MFKAILLDKNEKEISVNIVELPESMLPPGNVTVRVKYSSLNYKDGLAITGKGKIIRNFPMVPGIDFVGEVIDSDDPQFKKNDEVILTGWGVGESHWGGMSELAKVNSDWLVHMPSNGSAKKAMAIGTAGLTAMLCVQSILDANITPEQGKVLVTGASGGVGSTAVCILSKLGYQVTACTGRVELNGELLQSIGASEVIPREELSTPPRPLDKQRWVAVVDTVGGVPLANALAQLSYGGVAAICGLAASAELPTTVLPFILRGVSLLGIDSVYCSRDKRIEAWNSAFELLPEEFYKNVTEEIGIEAVPLYANKIVEATVTGRVVVKV